MWGYEDARPRLISPIQNTTFRVDTQTGETFCLRISHPNVRAAEILSELQWLVALGRDTRLGVPEPARTPDGRLLAVLGGDEVGGQRCCVLFRWVDGAFVAPDRLTPEQLEQVGALMAGLHRHARAWAPPHGFERDRVDRDLVVDLVTGSRALVERSRAASADAGVVVERTAAVVVAAMDDLGAGPQVFGLVHADLSPSNFLFHHGQVRAIDFDDCCWSYFLYDMALTLREVEMEACYATLRASLLQGYRTAGDLSPREEGYLDTFIAAVNLLRLLWVLPRADAPAYRDWAPEFITRSLARLQAFLASMERAS